MLVFLQLVITLILGWSFAVDGVRIWSSGCLLPCFGCPFDGIQSSLGEWSCAIFLMDLGVASFVFSSVIWKYLMFPLYECFVAATFELQIWCVFFEKLNLVFISDRFSISRRAQFRFQSGVNCSRPEICSIYNPIAALKSGRFRLYFGCLGNWFSWFTVSIILLTRHFCWWCFWNLFDLLAFG